MLLKPVIHYDFMVKFFCFLALKVGQKSDPRRQSSYYLKSLEAPRKARYQEIGKRRLKHFVKAIRSESFCSVSLPFSEYFSDKSGQTHPCVLIFGSKQVLSIRNNLWKNYLKQFLCSRVIQILVKGLISPKIRKV